MKWILTFVLLLCAFALSACSFTLAADVTPPPGYREPEVVEAPAQATSGPMFPLVPPDPTQGEAIFADKCAPCHGATGLGDGPQASQLPNPVIPIGTQEVARQAAPADWYEIVTRGNLERFMPPFSSLTDRQRWDVVAYTLSLSTSTARTEQGAALYQANCVNCHGAGGEGNGPDAAGMSLPDFTDQEFMAGKSGADFFQSINQGLEDMPAFSDSLSEDECWALTDYLRTLTFARPAEADVERLTPQVAETPLAQATPDASIEPSETISETVDSEEAPGLSPVSGFVMNASGGDIPAGLEVMLHGFDQMQIVLTETTTLEEDGSFLFPQVETSIGRVFLATVDFEGTTYGSDIATVEVQGQAIELPIQVYETTTDTSILFADRMHIFFELLDEQTVRVVELYIVSNPSNQTVVAAEDGEAVLRFRIPAEASNLQFQDDSLGGRYVKTEDGFGDTIPVRPGMGNYQVLFSYEMPYQRSLELVRPMTMPVDAVVILVPEDSVKIKGEKIQDAGVRDMQGVSYHMYSGGSLDADDELRLAVSGRSMTGANLSSSSSLVIGIAAFGAVLIVAGVWLWRRRAGDEEELEDEQLEDAEVSAPQSAEAVMDAILVLDDLYQEGQLPEEAYRKRREELKVQLRELLEVDSE